jgi:hypothetical protein
MSTTGYERRISAEEAREGRVLIEKSRLRLFPPVGTLFSLAVEGRSRRVRVESYQCTCRGPLKPHEHWFVRWPGLEKGTSVRITPGERGHRFDVNHR